jgi:hypothetical protein
MVAMGSVAADVAARAAQRDGSEKEHTPHGVIASLSTLGRGRLCFLLLL